MRGNENFFVPEDKPQYYWEDNKMLPFSVKVSYVGCFITIMFERSYTVFIVDPFEKFEVINIFTAPGNLELISRDKFFKGMGVMKRMLAF